MHILRGAAGRNAAAAAVAAAATTAAQPTAQARAPAAQTAARQLSQAPFTGKSVTDADGWLLAELQGEKVLFQPFSAEEVDDAVHACSSLTLRGSAPSSPPHASNCAPLVTEPDEVSSDGGQADHVIEGASFMYTTAVREQQERDRQQLQALMSMTSRLLKRPGIQQELVKGMLEDEELRAIMLRECDDLDGYLQLAGFPTHPALLMAPEGREDDHQQQQQQQGAASAGAGAGGHGGLRPDLVAKLVDAVATALGRAGNALAFLGGWLRDRLAFLNPHQQQQEGKDGQEEAEEGGSGSVGGGRRADVVIGSVMAVAAAVFCIMVLRRPLMLRFVRRA